jgi:ComF family protein
MNLLDLIYPKFCYICGKQGEYICSKCKKLFRRSLPECYVCRRITNGFTTHSHCRHNHLDRVFVCWEYDKQTSTILKKLKYGGVTTTSSILFKFFTECILDSCFHEYLDKTLLIPVPISKQRLRDRGFNQSEIFSQHISKSLGLDTDTKLIQRKDSSTHQALKDKKERIETYLSDNPFIMSKRNTFTQNKYKSITIVDDVITTGSTLKAMHRCIREIYPDIPIQAICMYRGRRVY